MRYHSAGAPRGPKTPAGFGQDKERLLVKFWKRFDTYIFRHLLGPFFLGLAGFTFVFLVQNLFLLARQLIEKRVPWTLVLGFLVAKLPNLVMFTAPMAGLLAILVGVGRLAVQHEILAIRCSGTSPWRLFRPVLLFAVLVTGLGLAAAHFLQPLGIAYERSLVGEVIKLRDLSREIEPGVFYDKLPGAVLYARSSGESPAGLVFQGVFLHHESRDGITDLVVAQRGRAVFDQETGKISLLLDDGELHKSSARRPDTYNRVFFSQHTLTFPADPVFALTQPRTNDHRQMLPGQLRSYISQLRQETRKADPKRQVFPSARLRKALLEWHRRTSLPTAMLFLGFAAFPLAAASRRGGRFVGLTQAVLIIFVFWMLLSTGWGLSENGTWPSWVGPWLPNLVTGAWGLSLWVTFSRRERGAIRLGEALLRLFRRFRVRSPLRPRPTVAPEQGACPPAPRLAPFSLLDRYLVGGFLRMFTVSLVVLLILTLALQVKNALDAVEPGAAAFSWTNIFTFAFLSLLSQLEFLIPFVTLFGASVSLAALSRGGEIVALKASGIGALRIALPLLVAALGIAIFLGAVQETVAPVAGREARRVMDRIEGRVSAGETGSGRRWILGQNGALWAYLEIDPATKDLAAPGLLEVDLQKARIRARVEARQGVFENDRLVFLEGWRRVFTDSGTEQFTAFQKLPAPVQENPELFGTAKRGFLFGAQIADQLTFLELWRHSRKMGQAGYDTTPLEVSLNHKLISPLLPVVLSLVGVPLMVSGWGRKGSLFGFGLSLLIVFVFWSMWVIFMSLGRMRVFDPLLAAWLAPVLVCALGFWLLARAR